MQTNAKSLCPGRHRRAADGPHIKPVGLDVLSQAVNEKIVLRLRVSIRVQAGRQRAYQE